MSEFTEYNSTFEQLSKCTNLSKCTSKKYRKIGMTNHRISSMPNFAPARHAEMRRVLKGWSHIYLWQRGLMLCIHIAFGTFRKAYHKNQSPSKLCTIGQKPKAFEDIYHSPSLEWSGGILYTIPVPDVRRSPYKVCPRKWRKPKEVK